MHRVDTRIVDRTIVTIQVISCLATIIVMALILTMVGASVYGILVTVHWITYRIEDCEFVPTARNALIGAVIT
jgi:hypothetical protein